MLVHEYDNVWRYEPTLRSSITFRFENSEYTVISTFFRIPHYEALEILKRELTEELLNESRRESELYEKHLKEIGQ